MNRPIFDLANKRVFVAGHKGMVGSAIVRRLASEPCTVLTAPKNELDLRSQADVRRWFNVHRPDVVILAAAKVGGIAANAAKPAEFLTENLEIQTNVITSAFEAGVQKLLFLGSSCIYPKHAPQPIPEGALLTGPLEPTNEWYAIAKIAGMKLCQAYRRQYGADFISAMPTNLYGPGDNFDPNDSHVLPALIRKITDAKDTDSKSITIWGTGTPKREFLHVDDLADAIYFAILQYSDEKPINIGSSQELSIMDLAKLISKISNYSGSIKMDKSMPDGTPRKLLNSSTINNLGWRPRIDLETGITQTIEFFRESQSSGTLRSSGESR